MGLRTREWPAAPGELWAQTPDAGLPVPSRPPIPDWQEVAGFARNVVVPRWRGTALFLLGFSVVCGISAWLRGLNPHNDPIFTNVLFVIAGVMFAVGLIWLAWDTYGRSRIVRRMHRRALRVGVAAHAYPATFRASSGGDSPGTTATMLLVDAALTEVAAARVSAAFGAWCDRLTADIEATRGARAEMLHRRVIALTEIFGPGAEGAWLVEKPQDDVDTPWRLLLLEPVHVQVSDLLSFQDRAG